MFFSHFILFPASSSSLLSCSARRPSIINTSWGRVPNFSTTRQGRQHHSIIISTISFDTQTKKKHKSESRFQSIKQSHSAPVSHTSLRHLHSRLPLNTSECSDSSSGRVCACCHGDGYLLLPAWCEGPRCSHIVRPSLCVPSLSGLHSGATPDRGEASGRSHFGSVSIVCFSAGL